jgi:hypothetical protein
VPYIGTDHDFGSLIQAGCEAFRQLITDYFKQAITAACGSQAANEQIKVLSYWEIIKSKDGYTSIYEIQKTNEMSKLLFCHYYRVYGEAQRAQEDFWNDMQAGLDLLSDEDLENYWEEILRAGRIVVALCG